MESNKKENIFEKCLFFNANSLARSLASIADESFSSMQITPTQGFTLLCVSEMDVHSPSEIARELNMKPSTITRFIEKLVELQYLESRKEGRNVYVNLTPLGRSKIVEIKVSWSKIYKGMLRVISEKEIADLTNNISEINHKFMQSVN